MAADHRVMAEAVRSRIGSDSGVTDPALRLAVAQRAAGGAPTREPHDALAAQIGAAAYRVSDPQVSAVRAAAGSDKATFEIVMSAAVGAGLLRWDHAMRALEEASNAAE
jgi:hypothetical protein